MDYDKRHVTCARTHLDPERGDGLGEGGHGPDAVDVHLAVDQDLHFMCVCVCASVELMGALGRSARFTLQ